MSRNVLFDKPACETSRLLCGVFCTSLDHSYVEFTVWYEMMYRFLFNAYYHSYCSVHGIHTCCVCEYACLVSGTTNGALQVYGALLISYDMSLKRCRYSYYSAVITLWKIAKVMESHGKVIENDDNVMEFLLLH